MKDIDLGKEYIIPSPGYRNVRGQSSPDQREEQDGLSYQQDNHKVRSCGFVSFSFHPPLVTGLYSSFLNNIMV